MEIPLATVVEPQYLAPSRFTLQIECNRLTDLIKSEHHKYQNKNSVWLFIYVWKMVIVTKLSFIHKLFYILGFS